MKTKKWKDMSLKEKITGVIVLFFVSLFIFSIFNSSNKKTGENKGEVSKQEVASPTPSKTPSRDEIIEKQFSAWDGSHIKLTELIKDSMNDPKSYEHVETVYWDMKDHLIVNTTFRGKNAFGGTVKNTVKAKISLDGEGIEILEQY